MATAETHAPMSVTEAMGINYEPLISRLDGYSSDDESIASLIRELPYLWRDAYELMSARRTSIVRIQDGSFEYIYDKLH